MLRAVERRMSEEEMLFGKIPLKEFKKHVFWEYGKHRDSFHEIPEDECDTSIKLIRTHSEPNLIHRDVTKILQFSSVPGSPVLYQANLVKSYIEKENVSQIERPDTTELNNTLEIIEYILNNDPEKKSNMTDSKNVTDADNMQSPQILQISPETGSSVPNNIVFDKSFLQMQMIISKESSPHIEKMDSQTEALDTKNLTDTEKLQNPQMTRFSPLNESPPIFYHSVSDESFLQMEKFVSEVEESENLGLNNTIEKISYIIKNSPNQKLNMTVSMKVTDADKMGRSHPSTKTLNESTLKYTSPREKLNSEDNLEYFTPTHDVIENKAEVVSSTPYLRPQLLEFKTPTFFTPLSHMKSSSSSLKKKPQRNNAFKNILSPIACYIKNTPQVPLVTNVYPRKPKPGPSTASKYVNNTQHNVIQNKENIKLRPVAYKSAKKTKVIQIPDQKRVPQSQWAKKITSNPPTIMKHEERKNNLAVKSSLNQQENSYFNLTCVQAEVSICTEKTAFKSNQ